MRKWISAVGCVGVFGLVSLGLCVSAHAGPIFALTPNTTTPAPGQTVTFILSANDGSPNSSSPPGGLVFLRFDLALGAVSGSPSWSTPTNPTILESKLNVSSYSGASVGTPSHDCVDDVILTINLGGTTWDTSVADMASDNLWSFNLTVNGTLGSKIKAGVETEQDSTNGITDGFGYYVGATLYTPTDLVTGEAASSTLTLTAVPEPATLLLVGLGGALFVRRRRRAS